MRPPRWLFICLALAPWLAGFDWPGRVEALARSIGSPDPEVRRSTVEALGQIDRPEARRRLVAALEDDEVAVRRAAAVALGSQRAREAVGRLSALLTDLDPTMRAAAAGALGRIGERNAVVALVRALGDSEGDVRAAAVSALGAIGTAEVVLPVMGRLDDAQAPVRELAAQVLGRLGDGRATIPLVGRVQDPVPTVRARAIEALGRIGDRRAAAPLLGALRDASPDVRGEAITALARVQPSGGAESIVRMLDDADATPRLRAIAALGTVGSEADVGPLLRALRMDEMRAAIVGALARIGARAVPRLTAALRNSTRLDQQAAIAEALGGIEDRAATDALLDALDRGSAPPEQVLRALARHGPRVPLMPVLLRLGDTNRQVVVAVLDALDAILGPAQPDGRATDPLLQTLGAADPILRARSAQLLGRLRSRRASGALAIAARDPDERVALAALVALGRTGDPAATPVLLEQIGSGSGALRLAAAVALYELAAPSTIAPLVERVRAGGATDRGAALFALAGPLRRQPNADAIAVVTALGESTDSALASRATDVLWRGRVRSATAVLIERLSTGTVDARRKAADVLGTVGVRSAPAVDALRAALRSDRDGWVRANAAWSLGRLGAASAAPDLAAALDRDEGWGVAVDAAAALGRLGNVTATPLLCAALGRRSAALRTNALRALEAQVNRCGAERARALAAVDPSAYVRAAALRYLASIGERDTAALANCAERDASGWVRDTCRSLGSAPRSAPRAPGVPSGRRPSGVEPGVESGEARRDDDFEFVYLARDGSTVRSRSRFYLVLPDRWVRAGFSDANGYAREDPTVTGTVVVEDGDLPLGEEAAE